MAQLITPPICIPASINFGSTTVASTYSNALSPWNGSSFTFNCTFTVLIQETSSYDTNPILQYNANNLTADMWFGLPNGNCYKIQSITSVNAQGTSCVLVLEDVDLYNLVVDNTGNGNNFPPEGFIGLFFTIGSDGLPVITPTEQIRSQIGDITNWLNDLHDRFRFRNYITDFFSLDINDTSYTGIVEGNFVSINSSGKFVKVTGTTENDLLSIAGIVSSADTPEQGNLRVRPLGRVVNNLNILVGSIGDVLYFDPNQVGSLTATKPATGVFPVYIKLSSTSAILKSGGGGASGTAGTAGTSGTSGTTGTSGATGTSGSSGTSGGSGTSGSSGTTGTSGTNGSSGTDGSSGTSGTNGSSGTSGTSGTSATSGSSATSGTSASSGSSGTSGTDGTSGTSGISGTDGSSGTSGTNGTDGSSGTSATSGTSGSSGTNGTSGTSASSGTAGTSGATGTAGTSGINGVSGGLVYWMNQSINSSSSVTIEGVALKQWSSTATVTTQQTASVTINPNIPTVITGFITDSGYPNETTLQAGNWAFTVHLDLNVAGGADLFFYAEVYKYTTGGTSTLLATTNVVEQANVVANQIYQLYADTFIPSQSLNTSDRVYCLLYVYHNDGTGKTITFYTEGSTYYSYTQTTFNPPSGTSGTSGVNGTSGTSGTNGTSGTSASSGSSGTAGTNGTSASSGTSGTNGTDGSSGSSGTTGTSGTNGTSGSSGTSASSGSSGTTGTSGTNGTTGTSGTSGTNGTSGSSATSGATGVSGTSGTSGANGSSGATGSSGSSGTSGGSGTSGSSGTSGTAGTSGSSGYASSSARSVEVFTTTAGQTTFTVTNGYNLGMIDVFVNGVKFVNGVDYTATNGTTVVLTSGLTASQIVEIDNYLTAFLPTNALRTITTFTATAAQTTFSVTYTQGLIDVYYNGSCLAQSEYTATNGTSIILATACQVNDIVVVYAYNYSVGAYSGIGGSGTANYVPKFTGASTIGNSLVYDDGTNVGIGTNAPFSGISYAQGLQVKSASNNAFVRVNSGSYTGVDLLQQTDGNAAVWNRDNGYLQFGTNNTARLTISSSGNVGIGTSSPGERLDVYSASGNSKVKTISGANELYTGWDGTESVAESATNGAYRIRTGSSFTERMRITSGGNLGIADPGATNVRMLFKSIGNTSSTFAMIVRSTSSDLFIIRDDGAVSVNGSLSKGSGSFKIDHPIESMKDTHHLVHSFVESPQANNIYRGKVQLINGKAEVNLDEVSTMTEGTFVLLNREIHTYTSNETDWDAVRGKIEGNILTIECQNNQSNAMVSWLVIGERQDKHMMDTEWTDDNGKVIVEPLKVTALDNTNISLKAEVELLKQK